MLVSLADLLGRLGSAWAADKLGQRWTMFIWGSLGAVGCVVIAFAAHNHMSWVVFYVGVLVTMAFGDGAFGILNAFGSEQFPNEARSTGLGLGYGIGATAKIFDPALMGAMIGGNMVRSRSHWMPYSLRSCSLQCCCWQAESSICSPVKPKAPHSIVSRTTRTKTKVRMIQIPT